MRSVLLCDRVEIIFTHVRKNCPNLQCVDSKDSELFALLVYLLCPILLLQGTGEIISNL